MAKTTKVAPAAEEKKAALAALDLGEFETVTRANDGVWFPIKHPLTGEDTATEFQVLGYDSDAFLAFRDAEGKQAQAMMLSLMVEEGKKKGPKDLGGQPYVSDKERELNILKLLVRDWKNVTWCGKELTFSPENLEMVLTRNIDIRIQLKRFIEEREHFFLGASSN